MKNALVIIILSTLLFSCKNENNQQTKTPEENIEIEEGTTEVSNKPAAIKDTIEVYQLRPGEIISSPLKIEGRARGTWYFEASFAIRLLDENGNELAVVPAEAQDSWMTEDWVPFEATLEFENPDFKEGVLVFEKANPSGLDEHDRDLRVKVAFVPSP
ncbi:hypothetical protein GCM10007103_04590 [Salinimicrobium marinum]|uniref:Bacterial spore germination immunoglobulin-like domain-containing protein n=1 Tax=Salinimicrobium marinum TaxID=680283 RepID=A0A918S7Z9_9FLAO|nr:Gmad2 immunoglobulin-like domain-containing protein [Salinimicrobium marinum]GHA26317.1 hypothetical protein GCM10007103_04590 [Salinimicrobium marinum]